MNNDRDCEHGRQIGKCADCEYQELLDACSQIFWCRDQWIECTD